LQQEESNNSIYRYAFAFYILIAGYVWYVFHGLGLFLGKHVFPQTATGFSVVNPKFDLYNNTLASVFAVMVFMSLLSIERVKNFFLDVGDELTRMSWADLKETRSLTLVVCVLVVVSAIFLFVLDIGLGKLINYILSFASQ
jgi:preprotein translocase subunit SecE